MQKKSRFLGGLLSAFLLTGAAATAAEAACTQANLTGRWLLHGMNDDGGISAAVQCLIKIQAGGRVAAGAKCLATRSTEQGEIEKSIGVTQVRAIKIRPNCSVYGGLKFKTNIQEVRDGINFQLKATTLINIKSGQLNRGKDIVTAVSQDSIKGVLISDLYPEPIPQESRSVTYFTLTKM